MSIEDNILQPEIDKFHRENPTIEFANKIIKRIHSYSIECLKEKKDPSVFRLTDNEWNMLRMNPVLFGTSIPDKPDGLRIFGVDIGLWGDEECR